MKSENAKVKPGYKHTALGWIPEDWEMVRLDEVSEIQQGISKGKTIPADKAISVPYMRVANVKDGEIDLSEVKNLIIHKDDLQRFTLVEGDILITEGGDPDKLGRGGMWEGKIADCVFQNHLFRIRAKKRIHPQFLYNHFQGFHAKTYFLSCAKQTTGIASINSSQVKATPIPLPATAEQRKIATILSTWNAAIAAEDNIITALHTRHRALMQCLLTGSRRLKGFEGEWKFIRFKEIYEQIRDTVGDNRLLALSVTKAGIVSQSEYFNKEIVSEDSSGYLVLRKGDMVMSGLNFWMGSIDVLSEFEEGMVSPAYKVFRIINDRISPAFMRLFVRSSIMLQALVGSSVIGASIVRRNMDRETLDEWAFHLPGLKEQEAIANFLMSSERQIALHRQRLAALQTQKTGLMQVLLTGKKRVTY